MNEVSAREKRIKHFITDFHISRNKKSMEKRDLRKLKKKKLNAYEQALLSDDSDSEN
jgi:hypothetical protein